ncbi:restriction of telomere capping protein 5 [Diplogelasinospora grovesii]|uniref:Restriction of telomere capping protein 5 n=1 Tax=Diplogelasinospora grovesii TaxID=303347 RepID=A0AAN6N722_9PEZI|nr:restriction of telomere capping protein 5 [Diplogelasinospora grovesii]
MGQAQSGERGAGHPAPSHEEVTKKLAHKFAEKCFTHLELYHLQNVFKDLADQEQYQVGDQEKHVRYLKEDTISRFLEIPDILGASPVVFQMISYIGAFPFLQDAPAVSGLEQMIMVITIMTERYRRVLAKGSTDRIKLLFKSLAVYDRKLNDGSSEEKPEDDKAIQSGDGQHSTTSRLGFTIDEAGEDEDGCEEEDDELVLAAFDSLDYVNVFKHGNKPTIHGAMIPADNFRKLIMLLLLSAPLGAQEHLSTYLGVHQKWPTYSERATGASLESLRATAENILAAFLNVERSPGIKFHDFHTVITSSMPFIFNGFNALFEHFLYSDSLVPSKSKDDKPSSSPIPPQMTQPLLQDTGSIMNPGVLSQLSFFIPGSSLFRKLRRLYSGDEDGFSMGSFETKVFHWYQPTILLVSGIRLPDESGHRSTGPESSFLATLPHRRFPHGSATDTERVTFGLYVEEHWKHTHRECFGSESAILFQLEPVHDVFRASTLNRDYVSFSKPSASTSHAGISFGCPLPKGTQAYRRASIVPLGSVSLVLDSSFEFGCFTHDYESRGGAFQTSVARKHNFQERFEVTDIEVWGCGGEGEAKNQAERWAWEAREAEARRRINLGTGDIEADRTLLEMAGLIGANRNGGSMA